MRGIMNSNNTNNRLREFILEKFPLARKRGIQDDLPLLENGILDSLGVLDLVEFVEKEFDIPISDEDLSPENFQTIAKLSVFIDSKRKRNVEASL
jgi:acyl carrier protein